MTRIVVPRGPGGSSSSANRSSSQLADSRSSQLAAAAAAAAGKEDDHDRSGGHREAGALEGLHHHQGEGGEERPQKREEVGIAGNSHGGVRIEGRPDSGTDNESHCGRGEESGPTATELDGLQVQGDRDDSVDGGPGSIAVSLCPPPPPVPPPKGSGSSVGTKRTGLGGLGVTKNGSSRRQVGWHSLPVRSQQSDSRPSSPKSFVDSEGYNSSDEQGSYFGPTYNDPENERMFEVEIKRVKGLEVKKMVPDGNCLFRAVADQVYGDAEAYDTARQMCIDYMERERDHFSQFITENFTAYCKRKRHDKIYGNNVEIQAFSEMYNRPIHIYCYSTEPINIFHGGYGTDIPPIRLSYHHGNHYNSLIDPRRLTIGAGLGLSSLQGANIDKDKVKAAIKAQQDQQIENALLTEGRFNSDLELTEKEIERMVMEASRAEYLAVNRFKQQIGSEISSTSASAEPSSSGGKSSKARAAKKIEETSVVLSDSMNMVLAMGFSYLQAIEAYSIFGDDIDSMVCYLVETGASDLPGTSRQKGKAAE